MIITLTGSNDFLIKQALDAVTQRFVAANGEHAVERINGETYEPRHLGELLQSASLFAPQRLIILRDAANNKQLWEALADWCDRVPQETTLAIVEPLLDKRTRTYKQLIKHSELKSFAELSERELVQWLQELAREANGKIDAATAAYLVQQVGVDQWQLWQEAQKLLAHNPDIQKAAIDQLVEPSPQASAFDLLDAVLRQKQAIMQTLLARLATTEDPYKFLGLLIGQIHALAIIAHAGARSPDTIAKEASLHPFVVRKLQPLARSLSDQQLKKLIDAVARCDMQLKSTGVDPWLLLEQCLGKIIVRQ